MLAFPLWLQIPNPTAGIVLLGLWNRKGKISELRLIRLRFSEIGFHNTFPDKQSFIFSFVHIGVLSHPVMCQEVGKTVSTKVVIRSKHSLQAFLSPAPENRSRVGLICLLTLWTGVDQVQLLQVSEFSSRSIWFCLKSLFEQNSHGFVKVSSWKSHFKSPRCLSWPFWKGFQDKRVRILPCWRGFYS